MTWETIDSAPKDEMILAHDRRRGYTGVVISNGPEWEAVSFAGARMGVGFYPTHWMPLPDLPEGIPEVKG